MKLRNALIFLTVFSTLTIGTGAATTLLAVQHDERGRAEDMAREAIEQLMRALELMLDTIPQYELPQIMENGDIIIRRKHRAPRPEPNPPGAPEFDETSIKKAIPGRHAAVRNRS
jgi:hypothetical protein